MTEPYVQASLVAMLKLAVQRHEGSGNSSGERFLMRPRTLRVAVIRQNRGAPNQGAVYVNGQRDRSSQRPLIGPLHSILFNDID